MKIWSAWIRQNAPPVVQKIFSLWESLNPNAHFHVVENTQAKSIINGLGIDYQNLTPQVKANIIRTFLLKEYGGLWVDATLLPTQPIDEWLCDLIPSGFFAFRSTGNPDLILQNWMLYSEPDHIIITSWLSEYCDYFRITRYSENSKKIFLTKYAPHHFLFQYLWKRREPSYFVDPRKGRFIRIYPYAMHNYTLAFLLKNRPGLAKYWSQVPTYFHIKPTLINYCSLDRETSDSAFAALASELLPISPVHKLNSHDTRFLPMIEKAVSDGVICV